jgi:hypothetical protein
MLPGMVRASVGCFTQTTTSLGEVCASMGCLTRITTSLGKALSSCCLIRLLLHTTRLSSGASPLPRLSRRHSDYTRLGFNFLTPSTGSHAVLQGYSVRHYTFTVHKTNLSIGHVTSDSPTNFLRSTRTTLSASLSIFFKDPC